MFITYNCCFISAFESTYMKTIFYNVLTISFLHFLFYFWFNNIYNLLYSYFMFYILD